MWRLRVRPRQPSLRGPREIPPGPTTWVRPATGWWERMKAGESPRNQGRSVWPPLSVSRRRSRGRRKTPQWSAERRAGPRHGPAIPSADGMGLAARQTNGRGVPRLRISALRYPLLEGRRVRNRQFGRKPAGMRRAATLPHGIKQLMESVEVCADDSPPSCPALCRASTPCFATTEGVDGWDKPGHDERWVWRNEPENSFWRNEPERTDTMIGLPAFAGHDGRCPINA